MKNKIVMLRFLYLIVFSVLSVSLSATVKGRNIDSLRSLLKVAKVDSVKIHILDQIIEEIRYSDPAEAYRLGMDLLALAVKENKPRRLASVYNLVGIVCRQIGDHDKSIGYTYQSMHLYEELKDTMGAAGCLLNLSNSFKEKKNFKQALILLQQALSLFSKIHQKRGIAYTYNNIANIYRDQGKTEEAMDYFKKSIAIKTELADQNGMAGGYMNLGIAFQDLKRYDEALQNFNKSMTLYKQINGKIGITEVLINLGELNTEKGNYKTAYNQIDSALKLSKELHVLKDMMGAEQVFYELYRAWGDYEKALAHFEQFLQYKDSTRNESNAKQIAEMGVRYDTDKKDREIEILRKNSEIKDVQLRKNKIFIVTLIFGILGIMLLAILLYNRFRFRQKINSQLSYINFQVNEQKKEITDSLHYARKVQESVLLSEAKIREILPESFLLYKPKQIVSGDFYWIYKTEKECIIVMIDNMLQGVPGAFISLIGINFLNRAVQENRISDIRLLMNDLNEGIVSSLKKMKRDEAHQWKLNYSICRIIYEGKQMECVTTHTPVYLINEFGIRELKRGNTESPILHSVQLIEKDSIYVFTDGYADQMGGSDGKKFLVHNFENLLVAANPLSPENKKQKLEKVFDEWKNSFEQVDDIVLLGFQVV